MTRQMDMECTPTWMGLGMKVTGKWINNMEKGERSGQTMQNTKEITLMVKSMDKEIFIGQMELLIMENSKKTI